MVGMLKSIAACLGLSRKEDPPVVLWTRRNPYGRRLEGSMEEAERRAAAAQEPARRAAAAKAYADAAAGRPGPSRAAGYESPSDQDELYMAWYEMLDKLHGGLAHAHYSISGRMAMSVWGCSRGARDSLSIILPVECREALRIWTTSTGGRFLMDGSDPDVLTFESRGSRVDGRVRIWRIRIRWLPESMVIAMPTVEKKLVCEINPYGSRHRTATVRVLTLPAMLDNSASAWVKHLIRGTSEEQLDVVAQDVLSVVDRLMELDFEEEGSGPCSAEECRHVLAKAFWIPFTHRYPDAPAKFAHCGLTMPAYEWSQPAPTGGMSYPVAGSAPGSSAPAKDAPRSLTERNKPLPELPSQALESGDRSEQDVGRKDRKQKGGKGDKKHKKSRRHRSKKPTTEAGPSGAAAIPK